MTRTSPRYAFLLWCLLGTPLHADERLFTYSYQATTIPKGSVELENWATVEHGRSDGRDSDKFAFRHELEFGLTDQLQLDVYLVDWSWTEPGSGSEPQYDDSAAVLKINYLDPGRDAFGLASYHEVKVGDELFELENKLLLQMNIDRFVLVYNLTLEAEWEGKEYDERAGEIINSFGASYEVSPRFSVGLEALHEIPLPDWEREGDTIAFAGPCASYRFGGAHNWWVTATGLDQLTGLDDEPEWEARIIVGTSF